MKLPRGFQPQTDKYWGPENQYPATVFDGRYYQPGDENDTTYRLKATQPFVNGSKNQGLLPLDIYQDWVELDWKTPHGSWESVERFGMKLVDEEFAKEIAPELYRHIPIRESSLSQPYTQSTTELVDELGDFLWPMTALSSNGHVSINEAAAEYLHTKNLVPRRNIKLKFVDIDYILASGFNPTKSPLDDPWDDEDFEEYNPLTELGANATAVRAISEKQYGDNEAYLMGGWIEKVGREELMPVIGRGVLLLGYVAQQWGRSTLAEVAVGNIRKVSKRAASNNIDKSDGPRT